jgi:hypothetical protein
LPDPGSTKLFVGKSLVEEVTMFVKRRILISFLVLMLILPFSLVGCGREPAANEVIAKCLSAMTKLDWYNLDTIVTNTYTVIDEGSSKTSIAQWNGTKFVNVADKEMKMTMNIGEDGLNLSLFEMYFVNGWEYLNQIIPYVYGQYGLDNIWTKTKLTDESWTSEAQVSQQIELLKTATKVGLLESETVDNVGCYTLDVVPSREAMIDWVFSQQQPNGPSMNWWRTTTSRSREIYIKAYKGGSIKEWIAKDSYLIMKADINVLFEVTPEDINTNDLPLEQSSGDTGVKVTGFEKITSDFHGQMRFYDYNKAIPIELPQEALKAQEH